MLNWGSVQRLFKAYLTFDLVKDFQIILQPEYTVATLMRFVEQRPRKHRRPAS